MRTGLDAVLSLEWMSQRNEGVAEGTSPHILGSIWLFPLADISYLVVLKYKML